MAQRVVNAGIDVSKQWLDVALWPTRETIRVSRDGGGLRELASWFTRHQVERIGIEASGGYEREVIDTLQAAGFEIALPILCGSGGSRRRRVGWPRMIAPMPAPSRNSCRS